MGATEFELIRLFTAPFKVPRAPTGPGDDCAVLAPVRGQLCVTTDAVVEGVHFTRRHFSFEDIGYKALAVNLSDLASMGARPVWFVCAIGLPRTVEGSAVRAMARGMARLARVHRLALVGGNFTRAPELSCTITAAGEVPRGAALLRGGGRSGDALYVSGVLGDARLGLACLGMQRAPHAQARQRRPHPTDPARPHRPTLRHRLHRRVGWVGRGPGSPEKGLARRRRGRSEPPPGEPGTARRLG